MFSLPDRIESKTVVFPSGDELLSSLMVPVSFLGSTVCPAMLLVRMKSTAIVRGGVFETEITAIIEKEPRRP